MTQTKALYPVKDECRIHLVHDQLARAIGLNEAIVLNQIAFLRNSFNKQIDGGLWFYMSVTDWLKQFPYMSRSTIRRTLDSLRRQGLIKTRDDLNKFGFDHTTWYSLNTEPIEELGYAVHSDADGNSGGDD